MEHDTDLSLHFLRVVEQAAIASSRTMGQGDPHAADRAAVEAMRRELDRVPIDGTIVIGEGERDEAPMLFIGERVGLAHSIGVTGHEYRRVDIAVDPLEGTSLCATGASDAITVLAAGTGDSLLHAPDLYMEKLIVGSSARQTVDLDAPVAVNLAAIARGLDRTISDLVIVVLDRSRHATLVQDIRAAGARVRLIADGDIAAGIAAAVSGSGVHAVMGTGAAPEGVITAAAMRCLGGEILGRLVVRTPEEAARYGEMGITDLTKVYTAADLAAGDVMFAATGVTDGTLMKGVRFFGDGIRTSSVVMQTSPAVVRFIDTIHIKPQRNISIRF